MRGTRRLLPVVEHGRSQGWAAAGERASRLDESKWADGIACIFGQNRLDLSRYHPVSKVRKLFGEDRNTIDARMLFPSRGYACESSALVWLRWHSGHLHKR